MAKEKQGKEHCAFVDKVQIVVTILVFFVVIYILYFPNVVYTPTQKTVLFFLISILPAILFGSKIKATFQLKLRYFCFTTAGVLAGCLGTLIVLYTISKPEEQIAIFHIFDESEQEVNLDWKGSLEILTTDRGLTVTKFVDGNTIVLIFPEQVEEAKLYVKPTSIGPTYKGIVSYAGSRQSILFLGKELKELELIKR